MEYAVGFALALVVAGFAWFSGFDRDRAFYPTILIVTASYYVLFAVMGGPTRALIGESAVMIVFVAAAVAGLKRNLWLAVAGFAAHAVFDVFHARIVHNPGVPAWWPGFCIGFDVAAAAFVAWLLSDSGRGVAYATGRATGARVERGAPLDRHPQL